MMDILEVLGLNTRPSNEYLVERVFAELDIIDRLWCDDDKDCKSARAFTASMRVWYLFMREHANDEGTLVNRALHESFGTWIKGSQKTAQDLLLLGRLRADAIEAAGGKSPLTLAEEEQILRRVEERHDQRDDMWANTARSTS